MLITRMQDEAHRFAITYHRSLRGKRNLASVLDDIPGVGEKRKKKFAEAFWLLYQNPRSVGGRISPGGRHPSDGGGGNLQLSAYPSGFAGKIG